MNETVHLTLLSAREVRDCVLHGGRYAVILPGIPDFNEVTIDLWFSPRCG